MVDIFTADKTIEFLFSFVTELHTMIKTLSPTFYSKDNERLSLFNTYFFNTVTLWKEITKNSKKQKFAENKTLKDNLLFVFEGLLGIFLYFRFQQTNEGDSADSQKRVKIKYLIFQCSAILFNLRVLV